MFAGCISLVDAPTLPATTLAKSCYASMFAGCSSLETAPELIEYVDNYQGDSRVSSRIEGLRNFRSDQGDHLPWTLREKTTSKRGNESELSGVDYIIDRDTFKSEEPAKTVIVADSVGAATFFDMKVHKADEKTTMNQKFLAQTLVGPNTTVLLTKNIHPRRDLTIYEDGKTQTLIWNNLSKDQAGLIWAVVYNEKDKAYVLNGFLDANGTAVFNGFKLRDASSITLCK